MFHIVYEVHYKDIFIFSWIMPHITGDLNQISVKGVCFDKSPLQIYKENDNEMHWSQLS